MHGDWFLVDKEGGIQECPASSIVEGHSEQGAGWPRDAWASDGTSGWGAAIQPRCRSWGEAGWWLNS